MWSFFRAAAPVTDRRNCARLALESLDGRCAPSSLLNPFPDTSTADALYLAAPVDGTGTTKTDPSMIVHPDTMVNKPPQIVNFTGAQNTGHIWSFTGDVIDESPGGLTITFGGEPLSLQGVTVITDSNGHFDKLVSMNTNGTDDGTATAQTVDNKGQLSNLAQDYIRPSG